MFKFLGDRFGRQSHTERVHDAHYCVEARIAIGADTAAPGGGPNAPYQEAKNGLTCDGGYAGCTDGGSYGSGPIARVGSLELCESCAVKELGLGNLSAREKTEIIHLYPLRR